jgi:hypothetical protein
MKRLLMAALAAFFITPAQAAFDTGDIICETTATTGTGTVNLAGAVANYATFVSQIATGSDVTYHITSGDGKLETGTGTFTDATPDTLTRTAYWSTDGSGAELTLSGTSTVCLGPTSTPFVADDITAVDDVIAGDDLLLSDAGVINFNSGDCTLTEGTDTLTVAGTCTLTTEALVPDGDNTRDLGSTGATWATFHATTWESGNDTDTTVARSAAGRISVEGADVEISGRQMIWIPAAAMVGRVTTGADCATMFDSGAADITIRTCSFADGSNLNAHFQIQMPKSWNESTVTFETVWTAASGSGTFEIELSCAAVSNDDALNATVGTAQASSDTLLATGDQHTGPESSAITCSGTPAENDYLVFQAMRDATNDTLSGTAQLIGIKLYITTNAANDT